MVAPSRCKEMARCAIERLKVSIRVACEAFGISQSGYHHQAKYAHENDEGLEVEVDFSLPAERVTFSLVALPRPDK